MSDEILKSSHKKGASHVRTSTRRAGIKLTKEQTRELQDKFLKSFASNGNVRVACLAAGIDRSTVHHWNERDEQFSMQYNKAKLDVDDGLRAEIFKRAMLGDDEVTTSDETIIDTIDGTSITKHKKTISRRKSDILLMFHAKARMPEYREKQQIDVNGSIILKTVWPIGALDQEAGHDTTT